MKLVRTSDGKNYLLPFLLITSLFFLWGFAHSILDVLNKHFQDHLHLTKADSGWIQAVVYGGYGLCALPAGLAIERWGYRVGVLIGLSLFGIGALLFVPGGRWESFPFFLFSLFVIGCGLTFLETSANPYATVLGDAAQAESRINLAQSFNGAGWILGPIVGGWFLFTEGNSTPDITTPYAVLGVVVLLIALVFARVKLPEIEATAAHGAALATHTHETNRPLFAHKGFVFGLVALFLYVAAQTGVNSFFINYAHEAAHIDERSASQLLGLGSMGLFLLGRLLGSFALQRLRGEILLSICALGATVASSLSIILPGTTGFYALFVVYLCESIMFPTIFALAIRRLGKHTKRASSFLIMSIVGGAVAPITMGLIADATNMAWGFVVPLACFVFILGYGLWLCRQHHNNPNT